MNTCETRQNGQPACGQPATHRLTQQAAGVSALACGEHATFWMRTKKVRGQVVRVHPFMTVEAL